jgi:hypothetical protein
MNEIMLEKRESTMYNRTLRDQSEKAKEREELRRDDDRQDAV